MIKQKVSSNSGFSFSGIVFSDWDQKGSIHRKNWLHENLLYMYFISRIADKECWSICV